jgi:hypothetical protein
LHNLHMKVEFPNLFNIQHGTEKNTKV